ncbi:hypothetical protein [Roseiconus lacunae]|uniref:hypothetical protein n=1 Tax=Roseiconus lacunae TaxID=2605694 RepID=UPI001E501918|nr:hypothetical protein [Roseiconus lacunae]MCD0460488.1 hypothetical protein [Roseiconus lacunae]
MAGPFTPSRLSFFSNRFSALGRCAASLVVTGVGLLGSGLLGTGQVARAEQWYLPIETSARESVDQIDPERIADVDQSREAFRSAVEELRGHLSKTTSEDNAAAWMTYLAIEPVVRSIDSEANDRTISENLDKVARRATGVFPGLEIRPIDRLRSAAHQYSDALRYRRKDVIGNALGKQLERFSDQWADIKQSPTPDDIATLRLMLDLLERTDQHVALVDQSRQLFSSPNVVLHVDESVVQQAINRSVDQTTPVRDCILGTSIYGNATMNGSVLAELEPSVGSIRVRLALTGTVSTNNIGFNRGVRIRTTSNAFVNSTRMVKIDDNGLSFGPVMTDASLQTDVNSIEHRLRLVRRIARKKAAEQKPLADRIAHRKLVRRVSDEFADETEQASSDPSPDLLGKLRVWLNRLDFDEPERQVGSTGEAIIASATIRKGNQLASPSTPPAIETPAEIAIQIHESVIDNTLGSYLAGRTLRKSDLDQLIERSGRTSAASEGASEEEFEIDFDRSRPIIFESRNGKLVLGIRGTRFSQGSRELKRPLEIVAPYRVVSSENGTFVLDRTEEVQINFPGTKRLSVAQAGLRNSIKQGFAEAFPQTLLNQPLTIPSDAKVDAFAGKSYRVRWIDIRDGWLTVGIGASDPTLSSTAMH